MTAQADMQQALVEKLRALFPDLTIAAESDGKPVVLATRERYVDVVKTLRDDPALRFAILSHLTAVHRPQDAEPFEVVVRLTSLTLPAQAAVKVRAAGDPPTVPSLAAFWRAANWHERETFDMFGVHFAGHPDHRRIFLEEDADFHPLRKEFPLNGDEG
jgi:NADH-quinone oxidoreductase subunit C